MNITKMDEHSAMMESFDSLTKTFQQSLTEKVDEYNNEMMKRALEKIQCDVKENGDYNLGININDVKSLSVLEDQIESHELRLRKVLEAKDRYLKSLSL